MFITSTWSCFMTCWFLSSCPTSNHNCRQSRPLCLSLYIVLFLHQTTTRRWQPNKAVRLYIVLFLHQTTTDLWTYGYMFRCISYYSYIKPQRCAIFILSKRVVYRTIPTSNHNWLLCPFSWNPVVYRTIPTSNHNARFFILKLNQLYIVLFLHQTTTQTIEEKTTIKLYIVLFLHQTTTIRQSLAIVARCISYYSYIKPQLKFVDAANKGVVYRTIPTSNHNWNLLMLQIKVLYIVLFLHQTTTCRW